MTSIDDTHDTIRLIIDDTFATENTCSDDITLDDDDIRQTMFDSLLNDPNLFKDDIDSYDICTAPTLSLTLPALQDPESLLPASGTHIAPPSSPPHSSDTVAVDDSVLTNDPLRKRKRPNLGRVGVLLGKLMREVNKVDDPTTMIQLVNVLSQSVSSSISGVAYSLLTSSLDSFEPLSTGGARKKSKVSVDDASPAMNSGRSGAVQRPCPRNKGVRGVCVRAPKTSKTCDSATTTVTSAKPTGDEAGGDYGKTSSGGKSDTVPGRAPAQDCFATSLACDSTLAVPDLSMYASVLANITPDGFNEYENYAFSQSTSLWGSDGSDEVSLGAHNVPELPGELLPISETMQPVAETIPDGASKDIVLNVQPVNIQSTPAKKKSGQSVKVPFKNTATEVFQRLHSGKTRKVDLIVRKCLEMFGNEWVSIDQINGVALSVGYFKSDKTQIGKLSLLTASKVGRNRSSSCSPWGTHFPYWSRRTDVNGDIKLQLSPEFMECF